MPTSEWDLEPDGPRERLRRLAGLIPGYRGYLDREASRDADRLLRGRVAVRLGEAVARLSSLAERLARSLKLDRIVDVDHAASEVRRVQSRCEHADYGYAGIFSPSPVSLGTLESLYDHDLRLVDAAEAVVTRASEAAEAPDDGLAGPLEAVLIAARAFEVQLADRECIVEGGAEPGGRTKESGS